MNDYCECCNCGDPRHKEETVHQQDLDDCGECHMCFLPINPDLDEYGEPV